MRTPTRLLPRTQRIPANEQHHQASNIAALNEDRIGIQSSRRNRRSLAMLLSYSTESSARLKSRTQPGPGRQVKVGIADFEDDSNLKSPSADVAPATVAVSATNDQCRDRWTLLFKSPPSARPEVLKASNLAQHNNSSKRHLGLRIMHHTPRRRAARRCLGR
jgi:hypothetical protein